MSGVTDVLAVDGDNLMAHHAQTLVLIREGFAAVTARPDVFAAELYKDFFTSNPRYRRFFEVDPERRDARTLEIAGRIVAELDRPGALLPLLRKYALEYRKYGVGESHYRAFAGSIMTALERTIGPAWTYAAAVAWVDELTMVASAMLGISEEADAKAPAYWEAEVVAVERLADDVVGLRARTSLPYAHRPGQYAAVEIGRLPWVWRDFSFATAGATAAPEGGSIVEFHVQRSADGRVTNVVHDELQPGDRVRISAPAGDLAFPAGASRLIAVGHGTGLAPIAALLEDAVAAGDDRPVHVVVGNSRPVSAKGRAASQKAAGAGKVAAAKKAAAAAAAASGAGDAGHYLSGRLEELARAHGRTVVAYAGAAETLPQMLDAYVRELAGGGTLSGWGGVAVGSTGTVQACLEVLAAAGADPADVRSDLFG